MSNLRGGSTMGGKPIATTDMIEKLVSQDQIQDWTNKMNKSESAVASAAEANSMIQDNNKNGFHIVNNVEVISGVYNYGVLSNLSTSDSKFQMYAPHKNGGSGTLSSLWFRTGFNSDIKGWEEVATVSKLTTELNKKFDKTGGTITGNTIIQGTVTANDITITNGLLTCTKNSNTVNIGSMNSSYCHFSNSAVIPFHFNRELRVAGEIYAGGSYNQRVWHTGNFDPNGYVTKSSQLANNYDLNNLKEEGNYRVYQAANRPAKINDWAYVEVIVHASTYLLQKIYNFQGTLAYMRCLVNGTWSAWNPMGGGMSFVQNISSSGSWTANGSVYEMLVTHNLGSENIVSVVLTDSAKMSMLTGFEVVDGNKVKVYCGENPTGKVVVNATP